MINYHSIKAKELETTKLYSAKKFRRYVKAHKILLACYSELFFWGISWIPFIAFPLIFGIPQGRGYELPPQRHAVEGFGEKSLGANR